MTDKTESTYAYWTRTSLGVCFPYTSMPAYALFPIVPAMLHLRLYTIVIALISVLVIWFMSKRGYTLTWFFYRLRSKLVNGHYQSRPQVVIRRYQKPYY